MQGAIETTLLNLDFAGAFAPTKANFPAFEHVWFCNETTAVSTLTDSFGNVVVDNVAGSQHTAANADGTITLSLAPSQINSGTLVPPGTKHVVGILIAKPSNSGVAVIGGPLSGATAGFRFPSLSSGASTGGSVYDGTHAAVTTGDNSVAGDGASLQTRLLTIKWGDAAGLNASVYSGGTWTNLAAGNLSVGPVSAMAALTNDVNLAIGLRPGLMVLGYFTTLPPLDWLRGAAAWMHARFAETVPRKLIYPGFKGLT